MTVTIQIIYRSSVSGSRIMQGGSFPQRGQRPEVIAWNWWQQIQREMHVESIEQVMSNGEDITQLVRDLDKKI
jgi:hypothetical protein